MNAFSNKPGWTAFLFVSFWAITANAYSYYMMIRSCEVRYVDNIEVFLMVLVAILLFFQKQAGFPQPVDLNISNRKRFLIPLVAGLLFGMLDILTVRIFQHPEPYSTLPPFLQPFPYSVFLYVNGAIYMELIYRLLPFTLIMLPVTRFTDEKYHSPVFMAVAIISSLAEPIMQYPDGALWFRIYATISGFAMNLLQAWYFRKYGFFASLSVRIGHYLVWHILQGVYVEAFELP
ncbi:MAG TPA: hypothetical protein VK166_16605 [Chitinophagaceae bacterium]|nr:hypothetical protein [Chitinophagaceae bacterium]